MSAVVAIVTIRKIGMQKLAFVCYLGLCHNFAEQECHTVPGPVEVGVQVGDQGASSLEVNVARLALLPKPVQRMTTEALYWEMHKNRITSVTQWCIIYWVYPQQRVNAYPKEVLFFSMEGGWAPGSGMSWMWILEGAWGISGKGILSTSTDSAFWKREFKTHESRVIKNPTHPLIHAVKQNSNKTHTNTPSLSRNREPAALVWSHSPVPVYVAPCRCRGSLARIDGLCAQTSHVASSSCPSTLSHSVRAAVQGWTLLKVL